MEDFCASSPSTSSPRCFYRISYLTYLTIFSSSSSNAPVSVERGGYDVSSHFLFPLLGPIFFTYQVTPSYLQLLKSSLLVISLSIPSARHNKFVGQDFFRNLPGNKVFYHPPPHGLLHLLDSIQKMHQYMILRVRYFLYYALSLHDLVIELHQSTSSAHRISFGVFQRPLQRIAVIGRLEMRSLRIWTEDAYLRNHLITLFLYLWVASLFFGQAFHQYPTFAHSFMFSSSFSCNRTAPITFVLYSQSNIDVWFSFRSSNTGGDFKHTCSLFNARCYSSVASTFYSTQEYFSSMLLSGWAVLSKSLTSLLYTVWSSSVAPLSL